MKNKKKILGGGGGVSMISFGYLEVKGRKNIEK